MRQLTISKSITNRESQSLQYYFNELNQTPILTYEEEFELSMLAHQGDEKAREQLIKHNLRFVVSVAKQYQIPGVKLEDLINEGNLGLIKASKMFDPTRGFKFISYAVWRIRQGIMAYISQNNNLIRKPSNKVNKLLKMKREISKLEQSLEREPSYHEICDALDGRYSDDEIDFYHNSHNSHIASLDAPLVTGEEFSLIDTLSDGDSKNPSMNIDDSDSNFRFKKIFNMLNDNERDILTLQFGLDGSEIIRTKEISEILGMHPSRIAVIRDRALRKLNYKIRTNAHWLKEINDG
tara:strand:+ start:123028 stop:123909 length:882 start_codon:yes stop_codon:yes gene_type:complete